VGRPLGVKSTRYPLGDKDYTLRGLEKLKVELEFVLDVVESKRPTARDFQAFGMTWYISELQKKVKQLNEVSYGRETVA
jgi:hypothetical protein